MAGTTGGATIDDSGTGVLTLNGNITASAGAKTLTLQGSTAGSGVLGGVIADSGRRNLGDQDRHRPMDPQ